MSASPRNSVETPRKLQSDGFLGTGKKNSKDGLRVALLASQTKEIRTITKNKYVSESSDLGYASKHSLDSFMTNNHDGNYSRRISTTSLADFDPKPLREFFSLKQPQIRVMVMKDNFEEPAVYNVRLMDLHESLTTYVRSVHTPGRGSESSPIGLVSTPIKSDFHSTDFEKILELRGRDLFCIAKPAGEVDIPVVIIRQHLCVICARYDMRAIIQDDRIIFIGQSPEDDFEDIKRHMQVFLRRSGKSPENRGGISTEAKTNTRESRSPESIVKDNSGNSRGTFSFVHNLELDGMHLDGFPFEIRAYEGLLATVIGAHKNEYETVAIESGPFFDILDSDPESSPSSYLGSYSDQARLLTLSQHQKLRRLKERITAILSRIKFTSTMIRELLEDKQLPFLCLTDMSQPLYNKYNASHSLTEAQQAMNNVTGLGERVDDIEFLLEHHLTECLQLEYEAASILRRMENAEQDILIRLNVSQTQVLIANVFLSVIATCIALGAFIAGLFGMNLDNVDTIQDIEGSFATVSLGTLGLITALAISVILLLQYSAVLPSTIRLRQKRVVSSAAQVSVDRKLDQHPDNQYTF